MPRSWISFSFWRTLKPWRNLMNFDRLSVIFMLAKPRMAWTNSGNQVNGVKRRMRKCWELIFARHTNMLNNKIVLDTNCLLVSISKFGDAYPVWRGFLDGKYTLCVSTEILEEYEEIIAKMTTPDIARKSVAGVV